MKFYWGAEGHKFGMDTGYCTLGLKLIKSITPALALESRNRKRARMKLPLIIQDQAYLEIQLQVGIYTLYLGLQLWPYITERSKHE